MDECLVSGNVPQGKSRGTVTVIGLRKTHDAGRRREPMRLHLTCVECRILDEIASSICARAAPACDVRSAPNRSGRYDYGAGIPTPGRLNRDAECKYRRQWLASPVAESSRRSPPSLSPATIMTWTPTICSRYIGPNSIDQTVAIAGTSMYRLRQRSWRTKRPCNNCLATEFFASLRLLELSKKRGSWGCHRPRPELSQRCV
jgi:hypothetical protein